jgi:hypothetical protein
MPQLSARIRLASDYSGHEIQQMYLLYSGYYDAATLDQFRQDLTNKSHIIEMREGSDLRGFSTLAVMEGRLVDRPFRAIFSGDTIIARSAWGDQALANAFCEFAGRISQLEPRAKLYWFLISKGYRTYRYLNLFARHYIPHYERQSTGEEQAILDTLATQRFGSAYSPLTGLIQFPRSQGHLKGNWAEIRNDLQERPDIAFFLQRNPGYVSGDELACLAELTPSNLRSFALRGFLVGQASALAMKDAA